MRPMFGAFGKAGRANSIAFVSKVCNLFFLLLFHIHTPRTHINQYRFTSHIIALSQTGSFGQRCKSFIWTGQEGGSRGQCKEAQQIRHETE